MNQKSMNASRNQIEKTLVGLSVESTLLHIGKPVFDEVERLFSEKYQCTIMDAFEHPYYLNEILREVFGESYLTVIKSIEEFLMDFKDEQSIERFIGKMVT